LASDLEGVNFSSIRAGVLEERQHWKSIQAWMIEHFMVPVYTEWLRMALISNQLAPIPVNKISKFSEPKWQPRGFDWIDPLKDAKANWEELKMGVKSRADILAEKGKDVEDVFEQIKSEEQLAESVGINIGSAVPTTEDIEEE
jgi:lambda family phage portal protein